jgi:hypothetical protein
LGLPTPEAFRQGSSKQWQHVLQTNFIVSALQEYIDHIQEIVSWMGWTPWKITYASQYFKQLHAYAIQLIKAGKAFVCHQVGAVSH